MIREAEVLLNKGSTVIEISRKIGIAEQTYYRWRKEYCGMRVDQAKRLKEIEKEKFRDKNTSSGFETFLKILKFV